MYLICNDIQMYCNHVKAVFFIEKCSLYLQKIYKRKWQIVAFLTPFQVMVKSQFFCMEMWAQISK